MEENQEHYNEEDEVTKESNLRIDRDQENQKCATFHFSGEDHTLGNALRHVLIGKKDVEFCGYSVPHPSERAMNVRLQTTLRPANEVLKSGLNDLTKIMDHIAETFDNEIMSFD
eukprot:CAMPEP_0115005154 /NCGR_PEP_ID=MMETSP0216-20121206/19687_1 /TAXON_ID=223996 /ORGANISM="Protocruzia adherens, Strain Boccale" /LENGTH=113 /DNA_ID=CAMNT_0002371395 /DNA_START=26 /DNA_END=367 /DNA_ORIENTATION=-